MRLLGEVIPYPFLRIFSNSKDLLHIYTPFTFMRPSLNAEAK